MYTVYTLISNFDNQRSPPIAEVLHLERFRTSLLKVSNSPPEVTENQQN